jgi:hypothetical protein
VRNQIITREASSPDSIGRRRTPLADATGLRYSPSGELTDLDAFSTEHRCCGDLDGGVEGTSSRWRATVGQASRGGWTRPTMPAESELDAEAVTSRVARYS